MLPLLSGLLLHLHVRVRTISQTGGTCPDLYSSQSIVFTNEQESSHTLSNRDNPTHNALKRIQLTSIIHFFL